MVRRLSIGTIIRMEIDFFSKRSWSIRAYRPRDAEYSNGGADGVLFFLGLSQR